MRFGAWSAARRRRSAGRDASRRCRGPTAADLPERNAPEDIACIFCTSGTTSRPKIVVYDHCAYWLNGLSTLEFLGLTENDRTLEYRSFGWNSAQVLSLMPFLEKGLTMHIAKRFSHSRFFEWIQRLRHHVSRPACRPCSTCCCTSRSAIPPRTCRRCG